MNRAIFVTGTDTGVGKTLVTGYLARFLREKGYNVVIQKWIRTGAKGKRGNIGFHLASPYVFKFPGSPHLASRLEKRKIYPERIINSCRRLGRRFDFVVIEGTGGCLVPFDAKHLMIEIAKKLNLPSLIVVQNKLGAINHTLLTAGALQARKMKIVGAVFNNLKGQEGIILRDNPDIIVKLARINNLGVLPWSKDKKNLYKKFIPIGNRVLKYLLNG